MRTITCTNPKNFNISKEKEYEILDEDDTRYHIKNDKGVKASYYKNLFHLNEEEVEVIPEVSALTLEDILKNVKILKSGEFCLNIKEHGIEYRKMLGNYIYNATVGCPGISCGAKSKGGINSIYNNYINFKSLDDFKNLLIKLNTLTDDDYNLEDEFFIKIITSLFNNIIGNPQLGIGDIPKGKQLLISLRHSDFNNMIIKRLHVLYPVHSTIVNINSGNVITTFIIDRIG